MDADFHPPWIHDNFMYGRFVKVQKTLSPAGCILYASMEAIKYGVVVFFPTFFVKIEFFGVFLIQLMYFSLIFRDFLRNSMHNFFI